MRAPECGFSAANCREGANSRQCIASTPAPPSTTRSGEFGRKQTRAAQRRPPRGRSQDVLTPTRQRRRAPILAHPCGPTSGGDPKFAAERGHGGVAVVVSTSTRRPTPRADRVCTVSTEWARLRPRRASSRRRARRPLGARACSCRVPGGRRGHRSKRIGGRSSDWERGRSRSACVVNARLNCQVSVRRASRYSGS